MTSEIFSQNDAAGILHFPFRGTLGSFDTLLYFFLPSALLSITEISQLLNE